MKGDTRCGERERPGSEAEAGRLFGLSVCIRFAGCCVSTVLNSEKSAVMCSIAPLPLLLVLVACAWLSVVDCSSSVR